MLKIFEKFSEKLHKLDKYCVLRQDNDYLIIGSKIIIKEHIEMMGNIFQPHSKNIDKELSVFFAVAIKGADLDKYKEFKGKNFPILYLDKYQLNQNLEEIEKTLEDFVDNTFKSN